MGHLRSPNHDHVVQTLQGGGCVLVMRHTSALVCAGEAGLDDCGRNSARVIGEALRHLHVPIHSVFASPRDRAQETARLAGFPRPCTLSHLDELREGALEGKFMGLRDQVVRPPEAGTNILIVSHLPTIIGDLGDCVTHVSHGELLVFRPDGSNRVRLFTRVGLERWPSLLQASDEVVGGRQQESNLPGSD